MDKTFQQHLEEAINKKSKHDAKVKSLIGQEALERLKTNGYAVQFNPRIPVFTSRTRGGK